MSASNNDPTPGSEPEFNFNSEKFRKSLDELIEFKVSVENFNRNSVKSYTLWSINIVEAALFARNEFEEGGWYMTSVERVFDDEFFNKIDPTEGVRESEFNDNDDEDEEEEEEVDTDSLFFEIMRNIDWR